MLSVGRLIDAVKINSVSVVSSKNHNIWIKRRRHGMSALIWLGNMFLRLSKSRIQMFTRVKEWQMWESDSFKLLHVNLGDSGLWNRRGVYSAEIAGQSLLAHHVQNTLTSKMLYAAGAEMRRAHSLYFLPLKGNWSHGDPHLANFIYDASAERCRLIDFETRHETTLSPSDRQADDVLVLLLDLLSRMNEEQWLSMATSFMDGYGRNQIDRQLQLRLTVPKGFERILWATRTNFLSDSNLRLRLEQMRTAIERRTHSVGVGA